MCDKLFLLFVYLFKSKFSKNEHLKKGRTRWGSNVIFLYYWFLNVFTEFLFLGRCSCYLYFDILNVFLIDGNVFQLYEDFTYPGLI